MRHVVKIILCLLLLIFGGVLARFFSRLLEIMLFFSDTNHYTSFFLSQIIALILMLSVIYFFTKKVFAYPHYSVLQALSFILIVIGMLFVLGVSYNLISRWFYEQNKTEFFDFGFDLFSVFWSNIISVLNLILLIILLIRNYIVSERRKNQKNPTNSALLDSE